MKRSTRAEAAQETVAICKAGRYSAMSGKEILLEREIRRAINGTRAHSADEIMVERDVAPGTKMKCVVAEETTTAALRRLAAQGGGHLACLNFASAKNPGGGFLGGAEAQEESVTRSSALYPCLLAAPEYYERNRACRTALYRDLAIWSPGVPFFRDDEGRLLEEFYGASVITAPAPNAGAVANNEPARLGEVKPTLRRRAAFVLALAVKYEVRRLVLGAWGCGVFRNDPALVAAIFDDLLTSDGEFSNAFDEVIFAIYDRSAERRVLRSFQERFQRD